MMQVENGIQLKGSDRSVLQIVLWQVMKMLCCQGHA